MSITSGLFIGDYRSCRLAGPGLLPAMELRFHGDSPVPGKGWLTLPALGRPYKTGEFLLGGKQEVQLWRMLWRTEKPDVTVPFRVHAVGYEGDTPVIDLVCE